VTSGTAGEGAAARAVVEGMLFLIARYLQPTVTQLEPFGSPLPRERRKAQRRKPDSLRLKVK
jgi:hypothetical protein